MPSLSCFTTVTNPEKRGDNYSDAIECYKDLADEVVIIDGDFGLPFDYFDNAHVISYPWPKEFSWKHIGKAFQRGYEACTSDWCIRLDIDTVIHEEDYQTIRQALEKYNDQPALSFYKKQFILPDRYNVKSRLVLAANKAKFGNRIRFDSGADSCQMSIDGKYIQPGDVPEIGIGLWNFECILKTKTQILEDKGRFARAWQRHFGEYKLGGPSDKSAYNEWLKMLSGRFKKPQEHIGLDKHPAIMQETIRNLKPEQFGYDGFGMLGENDYIKSSSQQG